MKINLMDDSSKKKKDGKAKKAMKAASEHLRGFEKDQYDDLDDPWKGAREVEEARRKAEAEAPPKPPDQIDRIKDAFGFGDRWQKLADYYAYQDGELTEEKAAEQAAVQVEREIDDAAQQHHVQDTEANTNVTQVAAHALDMPGAEPRLADEHTGDVAALQEETDASFAKWNDDRHSRLVDAEGKRVVKTMQQREELAQEEAQDWAREKENIVELEPTAFERQAIVDVLASINQNLGQLGFEENQLTVDRIHIVSDEEFEAKVGAHGGEYHKGHLYIRRQDDPLEFLRDLSHEMAHMSGFTRMVVTKKEGEQDITIEQRIGTRMHNPSTGKLFFEGLTEATTEMFAMEVRARLRDSQSMESVEHGELTRYERYKPQVIVLNHIIDRLAAHEGVDRWDIFDDLQRDHVSGKAGFLKRLNKMMPKDKEAGRSGIVEVLAGMGTSREEAVRVAKELQLDKALQILGVETQPTNESAPDSPPKSIESAPTESEPVGSDQEMGIGAKTEVVNMAQILDEHGQQEVVESAVAPQEDSPTPLVSDRESEVAPSVLEQHLEKLEAMLLEKNDMAAALQMVIDVNNDMEFTPDDVDVVRQRVGEGLGHLSLRPDAMRQLAERFDWPDQEDAKGHEQILKKVYDLLRQRRDREALTVLQDPTYFDHHPEFDPYVAPQEAPASNRASHEPPDLIRGGFTEQKTNAGQEPIPPLKPKVLKKKLASLQKKGRKKSQKPSTDYDIAA